MHLTPSQASPNWRSQLREGELEVLDEVEFPQRHYILLSHSANTNGGGAEGGGGPTHSTNLAFNNVDHQRLPICSRRENKKVQVASRRPCPAKW
jgi:hypothetical protein